MKGIRNLYLLSALLLFSCNEYTPKPIGYPRVEREKVTMLKYENQRFSFLYPSNAQIQQLPTDAKEEVWLNILYPAYNATIYCTYIPITKSTLPKVLDANYRLAYSHAAKAQGITQSVYTNKEHRTSAGIYNIEGAVAVPIQFFVTDSTSNFLRGSLYYNQPVNIDSVAPITQLLHEDIVSLIESLQWSNGKK